MKKQNVLDLLCDDFAKRFYEEQENLNLIIKEEEYNNLYHHLNIFLNNNYKMYNLDFKYDINSVSIIEKAKSLYLLSRCISGVLHLISVTPSFYKYYESEYGKSLALDEICFRVLLGNILDFKDQLKEIDEANSKNIIDSMNTVLEILQTTKYEPYT